MNAAPAAAARRQLLVFGRVPVPGRVKTRLIPALGPAGAAMVYQRLLHHALHTASLLEATEATFWCQACTADPSACAALAEAYGLMVRNQPPGNLGTRMAQALHTATAGNAAAVLIGSDCPAYSDAYLRAAFAALSTHDAVLGPAADGGYVLIGVKRANPRLFEDIAWSTSEVLAQTRSRLRELAWRWTELPTLRDIDAPADLAAMAQLEPRREATLS